jgi:outer membrane protein assembly factor BamB
VTNTGYAVSSTEGGLEQARHITRRSSRQRAIAVASVSCPASTWHAPPATLSVRGRQALGDGHANVYALDAQNGNLLWKTKVDPHFVARITAGARFYDGKLFVPVSSSESRRPGFVAGSCSDGARVTRV